MDFNNKKVAVNVNVEVPATITPNQLARGLWQLIVSMSEVADDAGCDWLTKDGVTYIAHEDWVVSHNPDLAVLVDCANLLSGGRVLTLKTESDKV